MKILDLTNLCVEHTKRLNKIADEQRSKYFQFIDSVNTDNKFAWWITKTATRNSMYVYTCVYKLKFIFEIIEKENELTEIVADDKNIQKITKRYINKKGKKIKVSSKAQKQKGWLCNSFIYIYLWLVRLTEFIQIKKSMSQQVSISDKPISIIDTFVLHTCFTENQYSDRYFNNLISYMENNDSFYFSTVLVNNCNLPFKNLVKKINEEKDYIFLVKEQFLTFKDYVSMLFWPLLCLPLIFKKYYFEDIDISLLMRNDISSGIIYQNSIDGMIAYYFIKRLKKKKTRIDKFILWYEGQPSSVGFTLGVRKWYYGKSVLGYIGLPVLENDLGYYPSKFQYAKLIVPDIFGVIGNSYVDVIKSYCKELNVIVCPALRYGDIWKEHTDHKNNSGKTRILLVLSYYEEVSYQMLKNTFCAIENAGKENFEINIKNHPVKQEKGLADYNIVTELSYNFVNGNLVDQALEADLTIIATTTSGMELIVHGINILIYIPKGDLINYAIPNSVPESYYKIVYSQEDIVIELQKKAAQFYALRDENWIQKYFEPVNADTVYQMLNFNNKVESK